MRNAFLTSIAVALLVSTAALGQSAHLLPATATADPPQAPQDTSTLPGATTPQPGTPSTTSTTTTTDDANAPLLPWVPDWATDLFTARYGHVQATAEALSWWNKNYPSIPLLIVNEKTGVEEGVADLAGGTGASLDFRLFEGGRFTLGYYTDECPACGIEATYLFLGRKSLRFFQDSEMFLGRTFFNAQTGLQDAFIVSFPGIATGNVDVGASSATWGAEVNYLRNIINEPITDQLRLDYLIGIRYFDISEDLSIKSTTNFLPTLSSPNVPLAGNHIQALDLFGTANQFFGAQVGAVASLFGPLGRVDIRTKVAIGTNHETISNRGGQLRILPNGSTIFSPGGVLVQQSNMGNFTKEQFTVLPELSFNWLLPITRNIDLNLGFTYIFVGQVIRPPEQIDQAVDPHQIPNFRFPPPPPTDLSRPGHPFLQSNYYATGVSVGFNIRW